MVPPHVIVVPYPAQGHVIPMMELSRRLVSRGVEVTFVNSHFNHRRVVASAASEEAEAAEAVKMVSISDGLEEWEDRNDLGKLMAAMSGVMAAELEALLREMKVDCVVADWTVPWVADVARRVGLRVAAFSPPSAATLAWCFCIPGIIADGIIDDNGRLLKKQMIDLSPTIPPINSGDLMWVNVGDEASDKAIFDMMATAGNSIKSADWIICNSSYGLEPATFSSLPDLKPIGPLLSATKSAGNFWPEDSACLTWLDQQPPNSVIYLAFGSFTLFDSTQFQELALGLELSGRSFLWVVRQDMTADADAAFPAEFKERVGGRGLVTSWAPQQQVLSHSSVACFVSHCGWNSTIEGLSNGVPFLCWPYFADQLANRNYICDEWKVGLRLSKDENGIVTSGEVKEKIERVLGDGGYKERIMNLREEVVDSLREGSSHKNFNNFIHWVKNGV